MATSLDNPSQRQAEAREGASPPGESARRRQGDGTDGAVLSANRLIYAGRPPSLADPCSSLATDLLVGQFVLCRDPARMPRGWQVHHHAGWHLGAHPSLPVADIRAADSSRLGWLLGHPIAPNGGLVSGDVRFAVSPDNRDLPARFEPALYSYGGRFLAICLAPGSSCVYLDPCGSLAAVFSAEQEIAASSPSLIPASGPDDYDHELIQAVAVQGADSYYPFGLTQRRSVMRLLPNHRLDLGTWQALRHWPPDEVPACKDVPGAVAEVVTLLKRNLVAACNDRPVHMSLTAGRDSRMLLACSRGLLDRIAFFTVAMPNAGGALDRQIAGKLARRLGLDHVVLPYESIPAAELDKCLYRNGSCVHGLHTEIDWTYRRLDPARPLLLGASGELGRAYHWRQGDTEASGVSVDDLLRKRGIPATSRTVAQAGRWLDAVGVRNALTVWGLLYNEMFNGCWFGPLLYGTVRSPYCLWPFCHRRIIEILMGLPAEYRRDNRLSRDVALREWPELLSLPFNWFVGVRRLLYAFTWRRRRLLRALSSLRRGRTGPIR